MVLAEAVGLLGDSVEALVDNDPAARPAIEGVPLLAGEAGLRRWLDARGGGSGVVGSVAIGGGRGADRLVIAALMRSLGIETPPVLHPSAAVAATCAVGQASHVLANAVVSAAVRLGEACIVNNGAVVDHECTLGDGVHVGPGATLAGCVHVGTSAFVGAGATVLPRIRIGAGATIGAGAVVTRDVPPAATVVGVPARETMRS
jgi:sugar O-acyltransferase (sialic acid O-acetyltransferase NeuD family)